jgi:hypothetical protein
MGAQQDTFSESSQTSNSEKDGKVNSASNKITGSSIFRDQHTDIRGRKLSAPVQTSTKRKRLLKMLRGLGVGGG